MLNTKQTEAITWWLRGRAWRDLGMGGHGYRWILCGQTRHFFLFNADDKIVDVQTD